MSPAPRLPAGSSLAGCVHRLARLQLTSEMRPPLATVDEYEAALDQLIIAARRVLLIEGE